jgi:hypothetical protein
VICPHALQGTPGPWVVFSAVAAEVRELGDSDPRWRGITGANSKELEAAVVAFNKREIDGLAVTYAAGSMGIRLRGARTLALIGSADPDLMAQAARRAPGAKVVLL